MTSIRFRLLPLAVGLFIISLAATGFYQPVTAEPGTPTSEFTIKVTGLAEAAGQVRIAVFNSEESWLDIAVYAKILDVDDLTPAWKIDHIPYGDYGIAVFHDVNGNGKNDANFIGMPKEPYGFSNNARGMLGPAKWKDSAFTVNSSKQTLEIRVK